MSEIKIEIGPIKVEIGKYREINKGAMKAFFSVVIHPEGVFFNNCRYFVQGDNRWISFPQEKIEKNDGSKPTFYPLGGYMDKDKDANVRAAILHALKDAKPQERNGQKQNNSGQGKANPLPPESPSDWSAAPF